MKANSIGECAKREASRDPLTEAAFCKAFNLEGRSGEDGRVIAEAYREAAKRVRERRVRLPRSTEG